MTLLSELFGVQLNEVVEPVDASLGLEQQLEILEQRVAAAKRGLGFSNKLKNPAQKKKHIALVLTNLNKIRANLAKVIAEISEVNGQFDRAAQGYEAGEGYARAVGEQEEDSEEFAKDSNDPRPHCPDCGKIGERKGHMECEYPQD